MTKQQNLGRSWFLLRNVSKPSDATFYNAVRRLLSIQLTVDWTLACSDGAMFHQLPHINAKFSVEQLQTLLRIIDTLLFLIDCELARHLFCTELPHAQIFMHDMSNTLFRCLQSLSYLAQLHFTVIQNYFVDFFDVFWSNSLFWASTARSIFCADMYTNIRNSDFSSFFVNTKVTSLQML